MSLREAGIKNARLAAGELLRRFGVECLRHVNVEGFAARLNIDIMEAPLDGASAQLVVRKDRASIVLSERLTDPIERRCAIAHELGHYVLKHPSSPVSELCTSRVRSCRSDHRDIEDEANGFAMRLLTPENIVRTVHLAKPMTLWPVAQLAKLCGILIESSAIRIIESTERVCAAVLSDRDGIRWIAPAEGFARAFGKSTAKGMRFNRNSLAGRYLDEGVVSEDPQLVPAATWLDVFDEAPILEHSLPGSEPGTVLTMLWVSHRDVEPDALPSPVRATSTTE